jgi:2-polyprenyl-3-methyl-5-hydroxy-6-metoxy-1,4-benzoquinol methylase
MNKYNKKLTRKTDFSDLIIYSHMIDFYLQHLFLLKKELNTPKDIPPRIISFNIFLEDFTKETGAKIEKLINKLIENKARFLIYPPPPCLFNNEYPLVLKNRFFNFNSILPPVFFQEIAVKYAISQQDLYLINNKIATELSHCQTCERKIKKECRGIFNMGGSYICHNMVQKWIEERVSSLKNGFLLDVGCGINPPFLNLYKKLAKQGIQIYLLDPSNQVMLSLKQRGIKNLSNFHLVQSTIEDTHLKNNAFDSIILLESYYHLYDIRQALNKMRQLLKEDGVLIIKNTKSFDMFMNTSKTKAPSIDCHFRNDTLEQMTSVLQKYHFDILDIVEDKNTSYPQSWVIKAQKLK